MLHTLGVRWLCGHMQSAWNVIRRRTSRPSAARDRSNLKYHCIYDKFISVINELQDAVGLEIAKAYLVFLLLNLRQLQDLTISMIHIVNTLQAQL